MYETIKLTFSSAPKGRNVIAWGSAPGIDVLFIHQALKGRHNIPPFQGLIMYGYL
jgi:hypothetical protein